jgi:hypothetical protein
MINKTVAGDREEPLMNFTKGEILKELLRLIASACRSGPLIADVDAAMSGPESVAKAMENLPDKPVAWKAAKVELRSGFSTPRLSTGLVLLSDSPSEPRADA